MLRLGLDELQAADAQDVNEWLSDVLPDVEEVLEEHAEALRPVAAASADLTHLQERTLELLGRLRHWHRAFDRACHPESPQARPDPQESATSTASGSESGGRAGEPAASVFAGIAAELTPASPAEPTESTDDLILWAQTTDNHAQLRTTPLSVAQRFAEQREHLGGTWIFVSATLAVDDSLAHFARQMGMPEAWQMQVASPFDYPQQAALWIPRGLGSPTAPDFPERVARQAWPLIRRNRGRAFVLCTTLRAMRTIAEQLRAQAGDDIDVLMQGEAPRHELMTRFREAEAAVLVGSAGFWEGVDIAGDKLSLVIIDKLPFAPPDDPIFRARSQAMARSGQHAFRELALPQATLALKQGAGRLIRTETDRGLLVICDERLRTRSYGARILSSLPPFRRLESFEEALDFLAED